MAPSRTPRASRDVFVVRPTDGPPVRAHAIVLAHGLRYDPPRFPGSRSCGDGRCSTARFATAGKCASSLWRSTAAAERVRSAVVLAGWSNDVVLCTTARPTRRRAAAAAGVRVRTEPIARLAGNDGRLTQIEFSHGPAERREALFVNTRRDQPNGLAAALGCELTSAGTIVTDADGRTNVAGVYAAGDAADRPLAVGRQRDRHRLARRLRGRARAPRAGRRRGRLTRRPLAAATRCAEWPTRSRHSSPHRSRRSASLMPDTIFRTSRRRGAQDAALRETQRSARASSRGRHRVPSDGSSSSSLPRETSHPGGLHELLDHILGVRDRQTHALQLDAGAAFCVEQLEHSQVHALVNLGLESLPR